MKVDLLTYTTEPERAVAVGAKVCYSKKDAKTLWSELTEEQVEKMISHLLTSQHTSPLEHANFTFAIQGIDRATAQQLTRHRHTSPSMQSQRYVDMENASFSMPTSIALNARTTRPTAKEVFLKFLSSVNDTYKFFTKTCGIKKEDARSILPLCTQSNIQITMNAAELYHIFALRCCTRAQGEFRELADKMLELVKNVAPHLFARAGASCTQLGYCPEGSQSCGKAPTLSKLLEVYNKFMSESKKEG